MREDRQSKQDAKLRARQSDRRERAELKAISRQGGMLSRARGGRQVPALTAGGSGDGQPATEPALAASDEPAPLTAAARSTSTDSAPSAGGWPSSIDLTADDDTLSMPKLGSRDSLDSLERKLRAIEQRLG